MLCCCKLLRFSYPKTFTKSIFFILLLSSAIQNLNAQIHQDFSDAEVFTNEHWVNPEGKFIVADGMLKLDAAAEASSASMSIRCDVIQDAQWDIFVKLNFNPSSTNYARIYLTASEADLKGALNGYYVMIGNTADEVSLYKQTGLTRTKIIDGRDGVLNTSIVEVAIRITRDADGQWTLLSDVGRTGDYILEGTAFDDQHYQSSYFGIFCNYTATRSSHFFFDDLHITGNPYVEPPKAQPKDLIITEIMSDPTPPQALPEVEYVEIYNRSSQRFNLGGYQLTDGNTTATLGNYSLEANHYVLLTPVSAAQHFGITNVLPVNNFPSLNNTGDDIILKLSDGKTIDSVRYSDRWFASSIKRDGGWSLELIDLENICGEENNWAESEAEAGGTPGKTNSINANKPDVTGPTLRSAIVVSPTIIHVFFDEKLEDVVWQENNVSLSPSIPITNLTFEDRSLRILKIQLAHPIDQNVVYTITCNNIKDCAGNYIQTSNNTAQLVIPQSAHRGDVVLNEILFNPKPGDVDFVELFNTSEKYISLKGWKLSNIVDDEAINSKIIQTEFILAPKAYVVFTSNPILVKNSFLHADEKLMIQTSLPTLPDDAGSVAIWNEEDVLIDDLSYHKNFHSPFIRNAEGVSLERISAYSPTNDAHNWKSASADKGYGTPTRVNSQQLADRNFVERSIVVHPEIFCPEFGQPNFTEIHYAFEQGGYMANIKILDPEGREIKHILNNGWLGSTGFVRWDGDQNDGTRVRTGYYMVWVELFDAHGIVNTIRKRVAIVPPR